MRVGLPLAGRVLRHGWDDVGDFLGGSIRSYWESVSARAPGRPLARGGLADVEVRRMSLGGGVVMWARRVLSAPSARPSWYALETGGWRDYVTLLHPPYTAWHLSYVVIGGCLAPVVAWGRLGAAVVAFALAVGVGAHALDELRGRPLQTGIPSPMLVVLAAVSLAGACAIGVVGAARPSSRGSPSSFRSACSSSSPTTSSCSEAASTRPLVRARLGRIPGRLRVRGRRRRHPSRDAARRRLRRPPLARAANPLEPRPPRQAAGGRSHG